MRIDFTPPNDPAHRAKVWAASMVLVLTAVAAVLLVWVLAISYLQPVIGFGAIVVVAAAGGVLSFGVGRVIEWLVHG